MRKAQGGRLRDSQLDTGRRQKYRQTGLAIPSCVAEATERYKEGQDLTKEWLEECFEFGPGYAVSSIAAFQSWEAYAEPRGLRGYIKNTRSLSKKLSGKGFKGIQRTNGIKGRGFLGLRLKDFPIRTNRNDVSEFCPVCPV